MKTMTLAEFHSALRSQGVEREHYTFRCPMCRSLQSASDLIRAGAGQSFEHVEKYLGFSCLGRFTGAPGPRKDPDGQPCDWTLGGLFSLHKLEVITEDGSHVPRFEVASPDEAQRHRQAITATNAVLP